MKALLPFAIACLCIYIAQAQKLPVVQANSIYAPPSIKIDGKATEWNNQLLAHNNVTNVSYTLANDDENLYLTVQAKDPRTIQKILLVGVSLLINDQPVKNKHDKARVTVTYPVMSWKYFQGILTATGNKAKWSGVPSNFNVSEVLTRTDSSVRWGNKTFNENAKNIKIKGSAGITDTLISIYNEEKIKVAANFGNDGLYTYELLIPLKYLDLPDHTNRFAYAIRLEDWGHPELLGTYVIIDPVTRERGESMDADPDMNSRTEFWGEYTLAKKDK